SILRSGRATIHVDGFHYHVTAEVFFQANRLLLKPFIDEVINQVGRTPRRVLELYAGTGFFSIPLARVAQEVIAIENNRYAVRQALENARSNATPQAQFVQGQVDAVLRGADLKPDIVVLDPPRSGCGVKTAEQITTLGPDRIVYISCNPSTFAREA